MMSIIFIIKFIYIISLEDNKIKIEMNRYIPDYGTDITDNIFYTYNFSLDIIEGGTYVLDTASFYSWKINNTPSDTSSNNSILEYEISTETRLNEIVNGTVKTSSEDLVYISLKDKKYQDNSGSICVPKDIPNHIKSDIDKNLFSFGNKIYNYLDLIKDKVSQKYINYVQETINKGYILLGEKDEIFSTDKNDKDIKTCKCSLPPDNDVQNEFLYYWNCKISSFSVDNIKTTSSYSKSINGDIFAIFALSEEYIIAPKKTGEEVINKYRDLIYDYYGASCLLEDFNNNKDIKIMVCQAFNYPGLPDFTITLEGEISMIALSYDLFKYKDENHVYFKILLNERKTKEYWYLGDPIIKNYNFLFDYNTPGEETITIVPSDKYESFSIIVTFCSASFIVLLFFGFLIFARIRISILSKEKNKIRNARTKTTTRKIKKIIRSQNDFEIPEGNIPIQNEMKNSNTLYSDDDNEEEQSESENDNDNDSDKGSDSNEEEKESNNNNNNFKMKSKSEDNSEDKKNNDSESGSNIRNSISNNSLGDESKSGKSNKALKEKASNANKADNTGEFNFDDLYSINNINSDEEECDLIGEEEGSLPPLNNRV